MRAVSVALDQTVDLDDVCRGDGLLFVRDGVGMAGRGVAARLDEPARLAEIAHDDRAGGGRLVAFATLPFDPNGTPSIVVPRLIVERRTDGSSVLTVVGDGDIVPDVAAACAELAEEVPAPSPAAGTFEVGPLSPVAHYLDAVAAARDAVRAGTIDKAVIAREVRVQAGQRIDVHAVLLRLRAAFGSSYRYCIDGLIGASPELLVAVDGRTVQSHPLAGTAPRTGDPDTDARVRRAARRQHEGPDRAPRRHRHDLRHAPPPLQLPGLGGRALGADGRQRAAPGDADGGPAVRAAATGHRAGTRAGADPALGGAPRAAALALIDEVEGFVRGRYGGAVGWFDAAGDGTFAVTIRCAELSEDRRRARLVAGGGIVANSDPLAELAETQAKLQAMLSAIVRP